MSIKELREKRSKAIKEARAVHESAEAENRAMTTEEQNAWDQHYAEADELRKRIETEERQREAERELEENLGEEEERAGDRGEDRGERRGQTDHMMATFRSWLSSGVVSGDGAEEFRSLSTGVDTKGGYLVVPEAFVATLLKAMDDETIVRQLATVFPMPSAGSIGIPTLDADPDDADWTEELATGSEDDTMAFGKRVMQPHPMAKRIKISNDLLRNGALPVETIVNMRMGYKFGITQEKSYMTGSGNKRPLGLFMASNDGIPTSRDVSSDNTTTAITGDGLINTKFSLKTGYWNNANWIFHRDVMKQLVKLKDGDGQYMFRESLRSGEPDILLGRPVHLSEFAPNTMTTGQYVGMLGDFSHYWIIDAMQMQLLRLGELYAETNQTGFIARYEGDGAPVLAEAFARVQLG